MLETAKCDPLPSFAQVVPILSRPATAVSLLYGLQCASAMNGPAKAHSSKACWGCRRWILLKVRKGFGSVVVQKRFLVPLL